MSHGMGRHGKRWAITPFSNGGSLMRPAPRHGMGWGVAPQEIKRSAALRERLTEEKKILLAPIQELEDMEKTSMAKMLRKTIKPAPKAEKSIQKTEERLLWFHADPPPVAQCKPSV